MTFEERAKEIAKRRKLISRAEIEINDHPLVVQKRKLIQKHQESIKELLDTCTHDVLERKSEYYDGSYYDKAHTTYWNVCTLCGASSERTTETHSWYG